MVAPITGEELYRMGNTGPSELVRGQIVRRSFATFMHGATVADVASVIDAFVHKNRLGQVFIGGVGVYTQRNPDTVRAADVAFVSHERMTQVKSQSYLDVAPELIVEVLSPDDAWSELMEKLDEYFAMGVEMVWVADPRTRQVYAYRSVTDVQRYTDNDVLLGGDVLPDFSVPVADLFATE